MTIEQSLHRKNLETAFLLASGWKPEDQAKLAEAIADDFSKDDAIDHDAVTCDCASCVSYMDNLLADVETERRMEVERARR